MQTSQYDEQAEQYAGCAKKLYACCFSTNCATICANKACFVRLECDTCSITQAQWTIIKYTIGYIFHARRPT